MNYPDHSYTNRERVGKAIDLLKAGLAPYASRQFISHHRGQSVQVLEQILGRPIQDRKSPFPELDTAALLKVMWESWNEVYRNTLGRTERTLVSELRDVRNRWAHQKSFSGDDAYRALDSAHRLLEAVSSSQSQKIEKMKKEVLQELVGGSEPQQCQKPKPVETPPDNGDLVVVVPARKEPFCHLFLGQGGEHCWHEIPIAPAKLAKIKYIAAYQTAPVSAITHFAPVDWIEPYFGVSATSLFDRTGKLVSGEKYKLMFSELAREIGPIPKGRGETKYPQGPRYTTMKKLKCAKAFADLW